MLMFECVCLCVCARTFDPWSQSQRKVLKRVMLIYVPCTHCALYDWGERRAVALSFFGCVLSPQVYTCCSSLLWNINPLLCLKLPTALLEYFTRKPAIIKYVSVVWKLQHFLLFCSMQRKSMQRVEFLIMRKPLQTLNFCKKFSFWMAFTCTSHSPLLQFAQFLSGSLWERLMLTS